MNPMKNCRKIFEEHNSMKFLVSVGNRETPKFLSMSHRFFDQLKQEATSLNLDHEKSLQFYQLTNDDHFSMISNLTDDRSDLFGRIVDFMRN